MTANLSYNGTNYSHIKLGVEQFIEFHQVLGRNWETKLLGL